MIDSRYYLSKYTESPQQPNRISLLGYVGHVFGGWQENTVHIQGDGFAQGDLVRMIVNQDNGTIEWRMNGIPEVFYRSERLKDKSIPWVPFVIFIDHGDAIKWIG